MSLWRITLFSNSQQQSPLVLFHHNLNLVWYHQLQRLVFFKRGIASQSKESLTHLLRDQLLLLSIKWAKISFMRPQTPDLLQITSNPPEPQARQTVLHSYSLEILHRASTTFSRSLSAMYLSLTMCISAAPPLMTSISPRIIPPPTPLIGLTQQTFQASGGFSTQPEILFQMPSSLSSPTSNQTLNIPLHSIRDHINIKYCPIKMDNTESMNLMKSHYRKSSARKTQSRSKLRRMRSNRGPACTNNSLWGSSKISSKMFSNSSLKITLGLREGRLMSKLWEGKAKKLCLPTHLHNKFKGSFWINLKSMKLKMKKITTFTNRSYPENNNHPNYQTLTNTSVSVKD